MKNNESNNSQVIKPNKGSRNSLSLQLEQMNIQQENIIRLSNAYYEAMTSTKSNVVVELTKPNGTTTNITIPSTIYLHNELIKLSSSFKNVIGLSQDGKSRLISNSESSFREIFVQDFLNSKQVPNDLDIRKSKFIKVKNNDVVEKLLSPLTTLELKLSKSKYNTVKECSVERFLIKNGDFSIFKDGQTRTEVLKNLVNNNYEYSIISGNIPVDTIKTRYYGEFEVRWLNVKNSTDQRFNSLITLKLDKIDYSDEVNLIKDTMRLSIGDQLVKNDGTVVYEIVSINSSGKNSLIDVGIINGVGSVSEGDILSFKEKHEDDISIQLPVRLNERSIIFVSPIDSNTNISTAKSTSKIFDSTNYKIKVDNNTYDFNQYFTEKVADIGRYFENLITERSIGISEGTIPSAPVLIQDNFKTVVINKHLLESGGIIKLEKLQAEKISAKNKLDVINDSISLVNDRISTGNYSSKTKKQTDQNELNKLIGDKATLVKLLSSIISEIKISANDNVPVNLSPKYKIRGFWDIQDNLKDKYGNEQKIVQYQIRYRYVKFSSNVGVAEQFVYTDLAGKKVNGVFSNWNYKKTDALQKNIDENGHIIWVKNQPSDVDNPSINQCSIPISYGETVEIQIRSISEAGFPGNPLMSEWSNIISKRVGDEFFSDHSIISILKQNDDDAKSIEFEKAFSDQGITKHIANSYEEQDKYFAHTLNDIASSKVTNEQKTISAAEYISSLEKEIMSIKELVNRRYSSLSIQLVDEDLRTYDVNNFSVIKMFAGNYDEEVDLTVKENYGTIVTKKFYLKITNPNAQTLEMLSIDPGSLSNNSNLNRYKNVPIKINEHFENQRKAQIFYNRNKNLNENINLYLDTNKSELNIPYGEIEQTSIEAEKNVVFKNNNGNFEVVKLKADASMDYYVACTTSHPAYKHYNQNGSTTALLNVFERLQNFSELFRYKESQQELIEDAVYKFEDEDKFLIGKNSVGASLFVEVQSIESYQVQGIDTSSSKEVYPGNADSIMIPLIFQYRMTDALGNANGENNLVSNANFEYSKTIGFDLVLAGKTFSFDVQIYSKYKATATSNTRVGIVTTTNNLSPKIS